MEAGISRQIRIRPMLIGCAAIYCVILIGIVIAVPTYTLDLAFYSTYIALACGCIPLPTTQMVMIYAERYDPVSMAILGGIAYCISALIDYSLVTLAFRCKKVNRIKATRIYYWLDRIFAKWPFGTLTLDSFSVIPFEPIKLMACAKQYNRAKYLLACFMGRTVRYYLIGWLQVVVLELSIKCLYGSIVVMLAIELVRRLSKRARGRSLTRSIKASNANPKSHRDNIVSQCSEDMGDAQEECNDQIGRSESLS